LESGKLPVIDQGQTYIGGYTNHDDIMISEKPVIIFGDHTKVVKYINFDFVAGADGIKVLKPRRCFEPKLLYYFLQIVKLPEKGYHRHFQFLEKSYIPVPPFPEQHRIVAKIEELFTKLDAGVEALKKIKAELKRYRQAVLKYAFEGKLTEEWRLPAPQPNKYFVYVIKCSNGSNYIGQTNHLYKRWQEHISGEGADWTKRYPPQYLLHWEEFSSREEAVKREKWLKTGFGRTWIKRQERAGRLRSAGKDKLETAEKLLERIKDLSASKNAQVGLSASKNAQVGLSAQKSAQAGLPKLPEGWVWARVGDIADNIHYGYTESASKEKVGPKFLRITDIQNNSVNWDFVPYCKINQDEKEKYLLQEGDLVFARTGATVGKSFLITGKIPETVFASYLIRISLNNNINKKFVYIFFDSLDYWVQINKGKLGIGQPNVNAQILSQIKVPLPSSNEQNKIVEEIERRFSVADAIEKTVEQSLKQADRLRQSILKRAFEGKLVQQDPSDLPAKKLLEQIRAEKEKTATLSARHYKNTK
jgi:restriction endonuclease S subunit